MLGVESRVLKCNWIEADRAHIGHADIQQVVTL
jgi:hypothetical protein